MNIDAFMCCFFWKRYCVDILLNRVWKCVESYKVIKPLIWWYEWKWILDSDDFDILTKADITSLNSTNMVYN